jgi:glycosyltransferase involved in cell wall biosynthesis
VVAVNKLKSKANPTVTVITVTRNAIDDLSVTVESVLAQEYSDVQFIVIDGGSTDGSTKFLEMHHDRIEYISEADRGIYDAMNKALNIVRGEWMIFLNAGDRFANSGAIQSFVSETAENISLVYSDYMRSNTKNPHQLDLYSSRPLIGKYAIVQMICHQAIFFNVANFPGFYDSNLRLCADLDILLNIYTKKTGKFHYLANPLVIYQGGGVSESDYLSLHREREIVMQRYLSRLVVLVNRINHFRIRLRDAFCS